MQPCTWQVRYFICTADMLQVNSIAKSSCDTTAFCSLWGVNVQQDTLFFLTLWYFVADFALMGAAKFQNYINLHSQSPASASLQVFVVSYYSLLKLIQGSVNREFRRGSKSQISHCRSIENKLGLLRLLYIHIYIIYVPTWYQSRAGINNQTPIGVFHK